MIISTKYVKTIIDPKDSRRCIYSNHVYMSLTS